MAADPTPEERAASNFNRVFEGRGPMYVARLADLIREAETTARSKAFEEAVQACEERRKLVLVEHGRPHAARDIEILIEKIRARAKEAPRG